MANTIRLKQEAGRYRYHSPMIGGYILISSIFGLVFTSANKAIAFPSPVEACDGFSFWQLPNGQCLNLDNLSVLGVAQSNNAVHQIICKKARESAQPDIATAPIKVDNSHSGDATLTIFPEYWEQKYRFAIQACNQANEAESNLAQVNSIISGWFRSVSDQVEEAYRNHHPSNK